VHRRDRSRDGEAGAGARVEMRAVKLWSCKAVKL
jgi:hypothetical protein